jgi:hypothetical protein
VNAFIVGAGFTRAVFPSSPLNSELLEALAQKKPDDSAARVLLDRYKTNDIEIALTKLDCDAQSPGPLGGESLGLRKRIEKELGDYFSSFCASQELMAQSPWLAHFVDDAFTRRDVVISLNYDCVLEGILDCGNKWSPKGGYGSYFNPPLVRNVSKSPVAVLKIHGSASFRNVPIQNKADVSLVEFVINEHFFPRSGKNIDFGWKGAKGPYLIAPSYVKVPEQPKIVYLMLEALAASTKAKNLVIIGTALRPEDGFLTLIVTNFLHQPSRDSRKIIIVDPCANSIGDRIEDYWRVNVSKQIVPIQAPLQTSVVDLVRTLRL